jgi:hypothetical protein
MRRTSIEGEVFLHKELWRVVNRQIERAETNPVGAFYDDLVAMVFAFHTLEAYLNCAGERIAPEFWKDERVHFRSTGFAGKLRKILELCNVPEPDKNTRPYSTVWQLKILRDRIAHARPERFSDDFVDANDSDVNALFRAPLGGVITHENARKAAEDIKGLIWQIHHAAKPLIHDDDLWFVAHPLEGALSYSTGSTTAVSD